ncbi:hypothetical protein DICA3_A06348 [Diutina catenulata]
MSTPKDFILEITPATDVVEDHNMLKFTIRHRNLGVFDQYRGALGGGTITLFITLLLEYVGWSNIKSGRFGGVSWFQTFMLICVLLVAFLTSLRQEPTDSIIVMKDIGVQLISRKSWRYQSTVKTFVPLGSIIDLVLHEGMHDYGQVIFFLVILTKPDPKANSADGIIKVVFPEFLPRKDVLMKVRQLSRELLFGQSKLYWRRVPGQGLRQIHQH